MIADNYLQLRSDLETALAELIKLAADSHANSDAVDTLQGLLSDLREPLLFVVVGEVKAGKSSLLNALFGQEFAKVDVLPATDRVYVFKYGVEAKAVEVSRQLVERYEPIEFLRDFNVVDTPGTNTMVAEHQTITENFIPRADLVLFVFSVINPWSQSAWELLNFVQKKWLKNIVFVLQQADLRDAKEIETVRQHLHDTALQRLGFAPPIFAVSARKALQAKTAADGKDELFRESNFAALENQIDQIVTEESSRMLKLESAGRTFGVILTGIATDLRNGYETILRDEERLGRVTSLLSERKSQTLRQVAGFLRGIEQACRESERYGIEVLQEQLSFFKTWRLIFGRTRWQQDFQSQVETKLRQTVQPEVEHAIELLETDLRSVGPQLLHEIETQFASERQMNLGKAMPDFSRQRRDLLQAIQLTLAERVAGQAIEEQLKKMFLETAAWLRLPAGVAAASGIVAVIAAMSSAAVADVTGVIAASAAILGTIVAVGQRRKILQAYETEMEKKRVELTGAIERQMHQAIDLFYQQLATTFEPLSSFCSSERKRYEPLISRAEKLQTNFAELTAKVRK